MKYLRRQELGREIDSWGFIRSENCKHFRKYCPWIIQYCGEIYTYLYSTISFYKIEKKIQPIVFRNPIISSKNTHYKCVHPNKFEWEYEAKDIPPILNPFNTERLWHINFETIVVEITTISHSNYSLKLRHGPCSFFRNMCYPALPGLRVAYDEIDCSINYFYFYQQNISVHTG